MIVMSSRGLWKVWIIVGIGLVLVACGLVALAAYGL